VEWGNERDLDGAEIGGHRQLTLNRQEALERNLERVEAGDYLERPNAPVVGNDFEVSECDRGADERSAVIGWASEAAPDWAERLRAATQTATVNARICLCLAFLLMDAPPLLRPSTQMIEAVPVGVPIMMCSRSRSPFLRRY
jgi:hypothetical protein